jgi:hypothetical protein
MAITTAGWPRPPIPNLTGWPNGTEVPNQWQLQLLAGQGPQSRLAMEVQPADAGLHGEGYEKDKDKDKHMIRTRQGKRQG